MGKTHLNDYQKAFEHAEYDIISDAECGVLRCPKIYKKKYKEISEKNNIPDNVRRGYMDGIESGIQKAM